MSVPKEMRAVVFTVKGDQSIKSIPLPPLRPRYLLIKVHSVALNPTDWKHVTYGRGASPFSIVGCDYAGTVISIGAEVTKFFKIGDSVYGYAHGGNYSEPNDGTFAEYAMVKGDLAMRALEGPGTTLSLAALSTIGLGSITVGQGLFQPRKGLELAWPEGEKSDSKWLLIYGGSTATGTLGIQFAKLAGYKVVTSCSPKNNYLVISCGADKVFDYHDPECGAKIRTLTENGLWYAWDTVGNAESSKICADALSSDSTIAHYGSILSNKFPREGVQHTSTVMYTAFGEDFFKYGKDFHASDDDYEFAKKWTALTEELVAVGKIKPHPQRERTGGLAGVLKGMEEMKEGKVRGEKLVYRI